MGSILAVASGWNGGVKGTGVTRKRQHEGGLCSDGTILGLDFGGGYTNLHVIK